MNAPRRIPPDFRRALQQNLLLDFFIECAYVHRAGYLSWIGAANRPETRRRRIQRAVVRLLAQRAEETATVSGAFAGESREAPGRTIGVGLEDEQRSA